MSASRSRWPRSAWTAIALGVLIVCVSADVLASRLPLLVKVDDTLFVAPCLTEPVALQAESQTTLRPRARWMVGTPIPFGPNETDSGDLSRPPPPWAPSREHWLGTDELGRDVAARLVHGARVTVLLALGAVLIATLLGLFLGTLAGLRGGVIDATLSRLFDVMTAFPTLFLLVAIFSVIRQQQLVVLAVALGLTRWADIARLARAEALQLRSTDYVRAAQAMGATQLHLIRHHIIPNALGPTLVAATFGVASVMLIESSLSFLGLGVHPPTASWGELLAEAHRTLRYPGAWWLAVFPGLALLLTVLTVQRIGEHLRRSFDVRL